MGVRNLPPPADRNLHFLASKMMPLGSGRLGSESYLLRIAELRFIARVRRYCNRSDSNATMMLLCATIFSYHQAHCTWDSAATSVKQEALLLLLPLCSPLLLLPLLPMSRPSA